MGGRDRLLKCGPAVGAEPLEARELGLDRHACGPRRGYRELAVMHDRLSGRARTVRGFGPCQARPSYGLGPQPGRVRIETQNDLALPLFNKNGKPVAEWDDASALSNAH